MTKNWGKKYKWKIFFDKKLQFTYVKDTSEAFSPQKQTSSQCCGSGSGIRCLFDPWNRDGSERRHSFVKYFETTTYQNLSLNQSIPCNSLNVCIPTKSVNWNARTWCWLAIRATAPPLLLPHEAGGGAAAALLLPQGATLLLPHGGATLFLSVDEGGGGGAAIDQLHLFLLLMLGCNCGF